MSVPYESSSIKSNPQTSIASQNDSIPAISPLTGIGMVHEVELKNLTEASLTNHEQSHLSQKQKLYLSVPKDNSRPPSFHVPLETIAQTPSGLSGGAGIILQQESHILFSYRPGKKTDSPARTDSPAGTDSPVSTPEVLYSPSARQVAEAAAAARPQTALPDPRHAVHLSSLDRTPVLVGKISHSFQNMHDSRDSSFQGGLSHVSSPSITENEREHTDKKSAEKTQRVTQQVIAATVEEVQTTSQRPVVRLLAPQSTAQLSAGQLAVAEQFVIVQPLALGQLTVERKVAGAEQLPATGQTSVQQTTLPVTEAPKTKNSSWFSCCS